MTATWRHFGAAAQGHMGLSMRGSYSNLMPVLMRRAHSVAGSAATRFYRRLAEPGERWLYLAPSGLGDQLTIGISQRMDQEMSTLRGRHGTAQNRGAKSPLQSKVHETSTMGGGNPGVFPPRAAAGARCAEPAVACGSPDGTVQRDDSSHVEAAHRQQYYSKRLQ